MYSLRIQFTGSKKPSNRKCTRYGFNFLVQIINIPALNQDSTYYPN